MRNVWSVGVLALLVGCGGGGDVDLGVKGSKKLSELDQADSCALYQGMGDYTQQSLELSCYASAQAVSMMSGDFETACQTAYDSCIENMNFFGEDVDCSTVENNLPAECDATVGELEACLADTLDVLDAVARARCDRQMDLEEMQALATTMDGDMPASCAPFTTGICGAVF